MLGLLFFVFIIATLLAQKTIESDYNRESKKKAIEKGKSTYGDYNGRDRYVKTNEIIHIEKFGPAQVIRSTDRKTILEDKGDEVLDEWNKGVNQYKKAKGHYGYVYQYIGSIAVNRRIFPIDNKTNRPYILYSSDFLFLLLSSDVKWRPDFVIKCYFKNDRVPDSIHNQHGKYIDVGIRALIEEFDNIEKSTMQILTKEEAKDYLIGNMRYKDDRLEDL